MKDELIIDSYFRLTKEYRLKYPNSNTLTIGSGLTSSTATSGSYKITSFTAGTGTISI